MNVLAAYFDRKGISFALVGALVPSILLSSDVGTRETRDADHVIKLSSWADWEAVISDLAKLGFRQGHGEQEHRLYYQTAEIDLIPYGISDGPEDILVWRKSGNHMNLTGFAEVFQYARQVEVMQGLVLPIVPLWLFAVLKVVAYLDRTYPRDLVDLSYVMEHYEANQARRFELAGLACIARYEDAGAFLLGNDIRDNVSGKALETVKRCIGTVTNEHHPIVNAILRETNSLYSDERRRAVYQQVQALKSGLA
jgi:predicted nucleotidyltransferase